MPDTILMENQLSRETSPYLLQHKDNPVAWRAWGPEALAEAAALDRPILLSVGYAACHWCHVMAHESFENDATAALMNSLFVPIKVDREERPDLDMIYQHALAMLGEQGGWPLSMFLTPEGKPFFGGTYFPPEARWGRAGFPDILQGVSRIWHAERGKIMTNVTALAGGLKQMSQPRAGGPVTIDLLDLVARSLFGILDPVHGGTKGAPKFPNPSMLDLIWRGYRRTGETELRDGVLNTLDHMCEGGIYDHLGGGFARYSTDAVWLAPHFEKMLYDNAQLVLILIQAWQDTGKPLYRQRIEETIGWVLREMLAPDGGFSATIDADSEHIEGKFYVWDEAEIDDVLGPDAALFKQIYGVTAHGNWEEKNILNRSHLSTPPDAETEALLAAPRATLLARRDTRIRPGLDDKVLADWNGLMIAALAQASLVFDRPDWLTAAIDAWGFVTSVMSPEPNRLLHSRRLGRTHRGMLDDHANMAMAALALHEATGDWTYVTQAEHWVTSLDRHFADGEGAYFLTADDADDLIERPKTAHDSAVPAGNGTMVGVLARLHALIGADRYREAAERLIAVFSGEIDRNAFPLATFLNGVDLLAKPVQIVIIGDVHSADTKALLGVVMNKSLPNRVLTRLASGAELPRDHPAYGKTASAGATAYICTGPVCSLPISEISALKTALDSL